jgi:RsiW-degrading membrane proteinase PrsW (M82 family)
MSVPAASLEQRRLAQLGAVLWALGCLVGFVLLVWMFVLLPLLSEPDPLKVYFAELVAFCFALPACFVYIWVPVLIDRFDPEPWWALLMTFLWGALAAAGLAGFINSALGIAGGVVGGQLGAAFMGGVVSAPLAEEALKGAAVLGMLWFVRREFDGVVDGVIYATFSALGFAMTENVLYYSRGLIAPEAGAFVGVVVLRGILEPWAHPLFSSLFGIGIGIARETHRTWLRWVAPTLGYLAAVVLHAMWNGVAVLSGLTGVPFHILLVLAYFVVMLLFLALMVGLVAREGYQLRRHLRDEVPLGYITQAQLDLICSPLGRLQAYMSYGSKGRLLVKAGVRLGMAKWHASRALQGQMHTISFDAVGPLRGDVIRLGRELQPGVSRGATQSSG